MAEYNHYKIKWARIQFLYKQYGKIFNKPYYAILLSVGFVSAAAAIASYQKMYPHIHPYGIKPF